MSVSLRSAVCGLQYANVRHRCNSRHVPSNSVLFLVRALQYLLLFRIRDFLFDELLLILVLQLLFLVGLRELSSVEVSHINERENKLLSREAVWFGPPHPYGNSNLAS